MGSGRNGGKLPSNAYNFKREKGLKQESQEKWGGGGGGGMQGAGGGRFGLF